MGGRRKLSAGANGFDDPANEALRTASEHSGDAAMLPQPLVEDGAAGPSVPILSLPLPEPQANSLNRVPNPDPGTQANGAHRARTKANGAATAEPAPKTRRALYDCSKCPGYCCSYPVITVTKYDVTRLARHFALTWEEAERRFTKSAHGYKRTLRRKKDEHYGKICRFFDQKHRRCGIYPARPAVCRSFPGDGHCGYWDFLKFERRTQNDPEFVSLTDHG